MTEHYGGGIFLTAGVGDVNDTATWDLEIDESGDIRTIEGVEELQKDLAFRSTRELERPQGTGGESLLGQPLTPTTINRIRARVKNTIESEERITRIISLDVREVPSNRNTVEIIAQVTAFGEAVDLVFMIEDN